MNTIDLESRHVRLLRLTVVAFWAVFITTAWGQASPRALLHPPTVLSNGWIHFEAEGYPGFIHGYPGPVMKEMVVECSTHLVDWQTFAVLLPALSWDPEEISPPGQTNIARFGYVDRGAPASGLRFYRGAVLPELQDWRSQIYFDSFGTEPFLAQSGNMGYVKFVIPADNPAQVIYFHSARYLFHFDFITARLEGFSGFNFEQVRRVTRFNEGRQLYIGSVIFPCIPTIEYGIQFDATDPLSPETVRELFDLVSSTVISGRQSNAPPSRACYLPSYEQFPTALAQASFFASNQIPLISVESWVPGDITYAPGWALARLKFVPGTNIAAAYSSGELLASDILLTDGVPADVPSVAGIIVLTPATPNSHVAILARSFGVPFVYLSQAADREDALGLDGQEVLLWTQDADLEFYRSKRFMVPDPDLDPGLKQELLALKQPQQIVYPPKQRFGAYTTNTDVLVPADIRFFGGKAANFGLLRRTIATNSPEAIAFSMDLWDDFLDQTLGTGASLRVEIASRLSPYTNHPVNIVALSNTLAGIRSLIRQTATFTPGQQQAITNALARFDSLRKIRFRSSTNLEDSEWFTGAGLYDSYSGCLADDLDADTQGPCRCDATEVNERGVFRAIQRVYASFYNDNAYLVRLQHGVDESTVGMGVLVHHSTPDEVELANGVATLAVQQFDSRPPYYELDMVTQQNAVSVTNPDGTAQPEVMRGDWSGDVRCLELLQPSSLLPLGGYVLDRPDCRNSEYTAFSHMFVAVAEAYAQVFPSKRQFKLDFEYKKVAPSHLQVKQVREVPIPDTTPSIAPFLLNAPLTMVSRQGIGMLNDFFQAHRLKSRWVLRSHNMRLTQTNAANGILADITWERANNGIIETFTGPLTALSNATYSGETDVTYGWTSVTADGPARFQLHFFLHFPEVDFLTSVQEPVYTISDTYDYELSAEYDQEVPFLHVDSVAYRTNESVPLWPQREPGESDAHFDHTFVVTNGSAHIVIRTAYWLDSPDIYTGMPDLIGNLSSSIEGLTSEPIFLTGFFSQTFDADHYVWSERFIFEPRVEPGISQTILNELNAADIRLLVFTHRNNIPRLRIMGFDGQLRDFTGPYN